jgi:hypothetical protein
MRTHLHSVDPVPTGLLLWEDTGTSTGKHSRDRALRREAYQARADIASELRIHAEWEEQREYRAQRIAQGLLSGRGI